jgi:hypothetical protein
VLYSQMSIEAIQERIRINTPKKQGSSSLSSQKSSLNVESPSKQTSRTPFQSPLTPSRENYSSVNNETGFSTI